MAEVLFVCPTYPRPDRVGLAMRAGVSLEGLARQHDVSVAVVGPVGGSDPGAISWARDRSSRAIVFPYAPDARSASSWVRSERGRTVAAHPLPALARIVPPAIGDRIAEAFSMPFAAVVLMRTYLAGAAVPFLDAGVPAVLDADDDDARTARSLDRVSNGSTGEADRYDAFQQAVFPWFDHVLFASLDDAVPPFEHLPNAVRVPVGRSPVERRAEGLDLVFVGDPGYEPNRDAVERLTEEIVPAIARSGIDVRLHRPAPDEPVAPFYERAHVAVAPLRAGGGTRIKILEAFAHGCPVVATPTGARGLEVTDLDQLVITADDDDAQGFATAVVDLAKDDARRRALAERARAFVCTHHDPSVVGARLGALVEAVAEGS